MNSETRGEFDTMATESAIEIGPGSRVYLRACRTGEPGTVIRTERGKLTVYWGDLDFWSRHRPEALEVVATQTGEAASSRSEA